MTLPGLLASFVMARSVPVIASVVLHAGVAATLVVGAAGGHTREIGVPSAQVEIDVEATQEMPLLAPVEPPKLDRAAPPVVVPDHTHTYPVDPSHAARPHDARQHHDHETPAAHDHDHDDDSPAAPAAAEASAALVAEAAPMPRFTMASGSSGGASATRVAADPRGVGVGTGTGTANVAGADDRTHSPATVQVAARLVRAVTAAYPMHARADEVEGDVAVEIVVDRDGHVVEARVTRPAGHGFDEAALAAVRAYQFSPAQREGRPVRVRMPWSVQFRLR